jgi:hypothetical protein
VGLLDARAPGSHRAPPGRGVVLPAGRLVPGLGLGNGRGARAAGLAVPPHRAARARAWLAIGEALDFRGPDPEVPRHVLEEPSEQDLGPKGCAPFC